MSVAWKQIQLKLKKKFVIFNLSSSETGPVPEPRPGTFLKEIHEMFTLNRKQR